MALWKRIKESNDGGESRKPYGTEVDVDYEVVVFFDEETGKDKTVVHLSNVSSEEDGSESDHKRQCVDLDVESARELYEILDHVFKFSKENKGAQK